MIEGKPNILCSKCTGIGNDYCSLESQSQTWVNLSYDDLSLEIKTATERELYNKCPHRDSILANAQQNLNPEKLKQTTLIENGVKLFWQITQKSKNK